MIELTREQRQTVAQQGETPPRALDPDTHTTYVLIREKVYARLEALLGDEQGNQFTRDMYRMSWRSLVEKIGTIRPWASTTTSILADNHECSTRRSGSPLALGGP